MVAVIARTAITHGTAFPIPQVKISVIDPMHGNNCQAQAIKQSRFNSLPFCR